MAKGETAELLGKLVGRYRIEKRLGSGGMGEVYLARQVEIGSRVAIKVMARSTKTDSEGAKRMFAEARAVNLVQHDRIVNVLDMTRIDGRPALIMEYLRGVSLDRLIGGGPLPPRCIADIAIDILDALSAVHAQEIYHRDLKPGNVFVSPEGRATLLDFGLAKMADDMLGTVIQTQVGMVMGTVPYMAPEQARGEPFTPASDIFAVGVLLYEALAGKRPFRGHSIFELLNEHKEGAARLRVLNPAAPPELEEIVEKALALEPAARYPTAGAMRNALIGVARGLEYASIRRRIEKFREASAAFIGVQPAFSNTPTVKDNRGYDPGEDVRAETSPRRRSAGDSAPPPPSSSSRSRWLLVGATVVATVAALVSTIVAMSLRQEVRELEEAAAKASLDAAAVPSLAEWKLEDASVSAPVPEDAVVFDAASFDAATTGGGAIKSSYEQNSPAEDLTAARRIIEKDPREAARLLRRAIRNGGTSDRYFIELGDAYCATADKIRWRSATNNIKSSSARATARRRCSRLDRSTDVLNPFD